jgi:hypothetical protein
MSEESRRKLVDGIYDVLEELGDSIRPSEIYGVLETVKMDVHDGAIQKIKSKKKNYKTRSDYPKSRIN